MDSALYYEIYGDGMDEEVIPRYIEYLKPCYLYCLTKNYVQRIRSEAGS